MTENIKDIYPLSPMQEGMLFHTISSTNSNMYKEQLSCKFIGELSIEAFKMAWEKVIERHDILRTAFIWEGIDEPLQVVHEKIDLPFEYEDCSLMDNTELEKYFNLKRKTRKEEKFEFSSAPLISLALYKINSNEHFFIWDHHHILLDGWALPIIMGEIFQIYESLEKNTDLELKHVYPYRNYIGWIKSKNEDEAKTFWKEKLKAFTRPSNFNFGKNYISKGDYSKRRVLLSEELSTKIYSRSKEVQITINTLFQGIWSLILGYYNNQSDVVFGATFSGRNVNIPGIEMMVGMFINTLPIRAKINSELVIKDWLSEFQLQQIRLHEYEYTPLFKIQNWSSISNRESLFDSILVFENYPVGDALKESNTTLRIEDVQSFEQTNYPITLVVSPGKQIGYEIAFNNGEFSNQFIDEILSRISHLIKFIVENFSAQIKNIKFLSDEEIKNNSSLAAGPVNSTIKYYNTVSWFEDVVNKNNKHIAVVSEEGEITFGELNARANQIAEHLVDKGIKEESIIGVCLNRSIDMIVSMMGINKAGCAILPIDIGYPKERIQYIVEDSKLDYLITIENIEKELNCSEKIIEICNLNESTTDLNRSNVERDIDGAFLNYVIYTSGSTGKPKGVGLQHDSLCNFVNNTIVDLGFTSKEKILQFSSSGFDAVIGEVFSSLLSGGTLYIPKRSITLSADDLINYINDNEISFAFFPPSYLTLLNPANLHKDIRVASVGDKCSLKLAKMWGKHLELFNGYGPTETTIGATFHKFNTKNIYTNSLPIGKGFGNTKIYVLNEKLDPVSLYATGELYIAGKGVGRGYLNKPDITASKYLPDLFSEDPGKRMYRTGDFVRLLDNGDIEFIGRSDFQVKLRGYRIELSEVESVLSSYDKVKDCAVKAIKEKNGNEYLAGYVISDDKQLVVNEILNFLRVELPDYMVPKTIMLLDEFPLTPNRKIDKDKLPNPDHTVLEEEFIELETSTEEIVANIWSDILKVENIGRTANFFELGGHSLLATQLISRLRDTFKKEIPFQFIFESRDLKELCKKIDNETSAAIVEGNLIEKIDRDGVIPLSYSQQRLWFLDKLKPGDVSYNIPTVLRLKGDIKTELFEEAFNTIIKKHEILRTSFVENNGKPLQNISDELNLKFDISEIDGETIDDKLLNIENEIKNDSIVAFDLSVLPLIRCKIFSISDDEIVLFVLAHHIISDGWSLSIMIREFIENYSILSKGEKIEVQKMELQFADYAAWQQKNFESESFKNQLEYWIEQLNEAPPLLELPYDKPKPKIQSTNCKKVDSLIERELVDSLMEVTRSENASLFMTMLAGFQLLLSKYSNQSDIVVGTPIAGRDNSQIENLIGFFVNNLAIRSKIDVKESFRDYLLQVRDTTLAAYANQSLPFDKLVEEIQPTRDLSHQPIFQVMFVFQNIPNNNGGISEIEIIPFKAESTTISYDLTLTLNQIEEGIDVVFDFNSDLFDLSTIKRFADQYKLLLAQIARDPDVDIEDLNIIGEDERDLILNQWNLGEDTEIDSKNVIKRFEEIVQNHGTDEAIVFDSMREDDESIHLTYAELNAKANKLARFLSNQNLSSEESIAICMERDFKMIVSMLGILKSGNAFIPIDPSLPIDRIKYMLDTANCEAILCNDSSQHLLNGLEVNLFNLDSLDEEINTLASSNVNYNVNPDNLAYIIYTSGSTGLPKGVMLHHKGLVNLAEVQKEAFQISNYKKVIQFSSLSFDASVWETVMALLNGAALYLTTKEIISSGIDLHRFLLKHSITTITLPPSVLAVLPKEELPELKTLITAGEAVPNELVKEWSANRDYFNAYGPTETTVCATMLNVDEEYPKGPPIGNAISNFETYVLDAQLNEVGIGIPGELCVGGVGLARGYINQPELTADKFIPNKYTATEGSRLYRTGDLVKYRSDGKIEFLGRIDTQVKIRGFRIEVGEIENTIKEISSISDAAVIAKTSGDLKDKIIAYIVCPEDNYDKEAIIETIKGKLPDYMLPNIFVRLDSMPLNTSGKVNKNALPKPIYSREDVVAEYVAPRNEDEEKLVKIVQALLKVEKVGIKDSFFELGGHSLLATQFVSRIRDEFNVELKLLKLFEAPTIEGVLNNIKETTDEPKIERPAISRVSRESRRKKRTDLD